MLVPWFGGGFGSGTFATFGVGVVHGREGGHHGKGVVVGAAVDNMFKSAYSFCFVEGEDLGDY
jgi:hypothetical protein